MNADIQKYRVWNEYTSMYDSSFIVDQDGEVYRMIDCCENGYDIIHYSENVVVERCSGLRDKNGNLIYENDVLKQEFNDGGTILKEVYYNSVMCRWYLRTPYPNLHSIEYMVWELNMSIANKIEIIGNIHNQEKS